MQQNKVVTNTKKFIEAKLFLLSLVGKAATRSKKGAAGDLLVNIMIT